LKPIDHAIKQILDECYVEAKCIVNEKRGTMEKVTQSLLQQETLSREEFLALMA
jgi:cell division protease FtsH